MKSINVIIGLLPALAAADFSVWSGVCNTGIGDSSDFSSYAFATDGQGACGGCTAAEDSSAYSGGNPCNGDCGADPLELRFNGDNLDIIVSNTGINVGSCSPTNGPDGACNGALYACSEVQTYRCITSYCN